MTHFYHFTGSKLRDGRPIPPIGEWLQHDGGVVMCESGLHASPTAFAALKYAPGEFLHLVELDGEMFHEANDKSVASRRKIVASIDATDLLRKFSRTVALKVIHLWNAPPVVREYLETGDESKRDAARDAAWAAARDAERDAAWAAARDAERDAAWAAARAAARDAERDAARDAAWAAARDAERDAARDAAWAAERDAAWAAARAAARAAAWDEYATIFNAMVDEAFANQTRKEQ